MKYLMVYLTMSYDPYMAGNWEEWEVEDNFKVDYHGNFVQFQLPENEIISYNQDIVRAWYLTNESTVAENESVTEEEFDDFYDDSSDIEET